MSIAEQIMLGTQQQSKNWSVLSENLGRLGQQVGQQLALREYQKQAAESLPIIQEQMTKSLALAGAGKSAEAYTSLVPLITNPSFQQNPYLLPALETGVKFVGEIAKDNYKRALYQAQYGSRYKYNALPSDEEILSDTFGTDTMVEGDGTGGGDIRVSGGQNTAKSIPGMEARLLSPDEQAYAEMMGMQQGEAPAGQPQEIAALRPQGQLDISLSGFIPSQKMIKEAQESYNDYRSKSEDEKKDFISDIPATGKAPEEGDKMEIWGMGTGTVIGPKAAPEPEEMEVTGKEVGITGGKPYKKLKQERKKKTPEEIKAEKEEQDKYNAWRKDYSTAKLMFQRNSQLRNILERAGGDITKLDFDIETVTNDANERVQVANIRIGDEVVGQLETTAPEGIMSEFQAYTAITGAPILFGEGSKWKFYKTESEEKPAAVAPTGGTQRISLEETARGGAAPAAQPTAAGYQKFIDAQLESALGLPTYADEQPTQNYTANLLTLANSATPKFKDFLKSVAKNPPPPERAQQATQYNQEYEATPEDQKAAYRQGVSIVIPSKKEIGEIKNKYGEFFFEFDSDQKKIVGDGIEGVVLSPARVPKSATKGSKGISSTYGTNLEDLMTYKKGIDGSLEQLGDEKLKKFLAKNGGIFNVGFKQEGKKKIVNADGNEEEVPSKITLFPKSIDPEKLSPEDRGKYEIEITPTQLAAFQSIKGMPGEMNRLRAQKSDSSLVKVGAQGPTAEAAKGLPAMQPSTGKFTEGKVYSQGGKKYRYTQGKFLAID